MFSSDIAHCSYHHAKNVSTNYRSVLSKKNNLLKRVQETCKKYQEKPLPPTFKTKLDGPPATWRVFSRLLMATEYVDTSTKDCMVFSFEEKNSNTGQRLFLVAHPQNLWQNHRVRQLEERCTYEVIREDYPCKLYFDLEFYTSFNSEKDGNLMTEIFIKCVIASMYEQHGLLLNESDFLWLDASNAEKFSCHLILQMKTIAFKNNLHAGTFVSILLSTLRKRIEQDASSDELWPSAQEIKTLLVISKKEKTVFFCDEGVYTRNRNFRLYLSTKQGKKSPLLLSPFNKYVPFVTADLKEEAIFYDSLITYFRFKACTRLLYYDENRQADAPQSSFARRIKIDKPGVSGCAASPYPNLDNFVLELVKDQLRIGYIRKWTYDSTEQKMIYDIANYRYCENIGRHHKSNNIKIVIDMKFKCYYQTCLDPECRQENYRSEVRTLPEGFSFLNVPDDFFDENCFSQLQPQENITDNNDTEYNSEELFNTCSFEVYFDTKKINAKATDHYNFNRNSVNEDECIEWDSNCDDFSELCKVTSQVEVASVKNSEATDTFSKTEMNHEFKARSLEDCFVEKFSNTEEVHEINEHVKEDFSFLDNEDSWNTDTATKDPLVSLENVSHEEEMLMAEAAEAVEATITDDVFSEETMF